jgi:hypothetical protein
MLRSIRILFVLLLFSATARAQICTSVTALRSAANVSRLQRVLLASPVAERPNTDVPATLRPALHDFKQGLIETVDLALRCDAVDLTDPAKIQFALADILHARRPSTPEPETEGHYGDDLNLAVAAVKEIPGLISIRIGYRVPCGDDNILLVYRHTSSRWQRALVWQNPALDSIGRAFGDVFEFGPVPAPRPTFVIVHGQPWCSSNMSGLQVDLVTLATTIAPQQKLDHLEQIYFRPGDVHFKPEPGGFEIRATVETADTSVIWRPEILRYTTTTGRMQRRQPIAYNARGFTDAWFSSYWHDAASWSDPQALIALKSAYDHARDKDAPAVEYGAVRACRSGVSHFQVELSRTKYTTSKDNKTTWRNVSPLYAQVQQNLNSFTMLAVTNEPDNTCIGPDLMTPLTPCKVNLNAEAQIAGYPTSRF